GRQLRSGGPIVARARGRDDLDRKLAGRIRNDQLLAHLDAIDVADVVRAGELPIVDAVRLADAVEVLARPHAMPDGRRTTRPGHREGEKRQQSQSRPRMSAVA